MENQKKERDISQKMSLKRVLAAWTPAYRSDPITFKAASMPNTYAAVIKHDGGRRFGWIEEVPGVNCQAKTREELLQSLKTLSRPQPPDTPKNPSPYEAVFASQTSS